MAKISSQVVNDLKKQIDQVTGDAEGIPGCVYCAVNKDGDLILEHASGKVGAGKSEPMTMDTVFWIASCTKMITGIAAMQLVEQGKLSLDDGDQIEKIAPVSEPPPQARVPVEELLATTSLRWYSSVTEKVASGIIYDQYWEARY